jgi:hypothetical protein
VIQAAGLLFGTRSAFWQEDNLIKALGRLCLERKGYMAWVDRVECAGIDTNLA